MTVCIQCAMAAMLEGRLYAGEDETPEAHMARVHPDPVLTMFERRRLEKAVIEALPMRPMREDK